MSRHSRGSPKQDVSQPKLMASEGLNGAVDSRLQLQATLRHVFISGGKALGFPKVNGSGPTVENLPKSKPTEPSAFRAPAFLSASSLSHESWAPRINKPLVD